MKNELTVIEKKTTAVQIKDAAWNSLSEESQKAYNYDYKLFFEFVKKDAKDITASDVLEFIEHLEDNNYKNNSINRKIASLSKMFKVMILAGEIKINPVEALKQFKNINRKTSKSINISLSLRDIKNTVKVDKNSSEQEHKMSLIIRTLAMTGLRISEFINMKNNDITEFDKDNQIINIVGKGKKERQIYLENKFIEEIKKIYPDKDGVSYLFYTLRGNKYNRKALYKQIREKFRAKIDKDVHPHLLRHWFATYKINVEKQDIKAVSKFLGHFSVSITLDAYVDTALDVKKSKIKI